MFIHVLFHLPKFIRLKSLHKDIIQKQKKEGINRPSLGHFNY